MGAGWRTILGSAAAALALAGAGAAGAAPRLHAMFQDHAVLQRERPVPVWGRADPGERVTVEIAGQSAQAVADAQGRWRAQLPALAAGGPYVLTARGAGGSGQSVGDVLVGDVWLCSGQSNMEMQLKYVTNAYNEVQSARNPAIRLFQVDKTTNASPLEDFDPVKKPPVWQPTTPESAAEFSAVCYLFAKELQKTVKVPQGLIHASWGGSTIQAWLDEPDLRRLGYGPSVDALATYRTDPAAAGRQWGKSFEGWWTRNQPAAGRPWIDDVSGWKTAPAALGAWESWGDPQLASFDGLVWMRTTVDLTAAQARQAAVLNLGDVSNGGDITWVNGEPVGADRTWAPGRAYKLRKGLLKPGRNTITVGVFNIWAEGGLTSPREKMTLSLGGTSVPLDQPWRYKLGTSGNSAAPLPPWDQLFGVSMLRKGMLAPIGPYGYRGVLWYQGESNSVWGQDYAPMLKALISEFRQDQTGDVSALVVQLAAFGSRAEKPVDTGWVRVREAQRKVVAEDPKAGLALAIDIGDPLDVHPGQKTELARRLARAARHVSYGEAIAPSGPVPAGARLQGGRVEIPFRDVTGRLVSYSSDRVIGFETCAADGSGCAYADARIEGGAAVLTPPAGQAPGLVRFCWADSPICNLYDESGVPAGPFEIPIQR